MNKWIAEFELEDGDTMPEHMDLNYKGFRLDFHCRPANENESEDYISRGEVIGMIKETAQYHTGDSFNADRLIRYTNELPSVHPDKVFTKTDLDCVIKAIQDDYCSRIMELQKAKSLMEKQIEMLKLDRDCERSALTRDIFLNKLKEYKNKKPYVTHIKIDDLIEALEKAETAGENANGSN